MGTGPRIQQQAGLGERDRFARGVMHNHGAAPDQVQLAQRSARRKLVNAAQGAGVQDRCPHREVGQQGLEPVGHFWTLWQVICTLRHLKDSRSEDSDVTGNDPARPANPILKEPT
ncbi:hypothetical protein D3C71_1729350 [compost metagenome]